MPFTSVLAEIETAEMTDNWKVAWSADPLGTVEGVQLAAVFQSPLVGVRLHVALPEKAGEAKSVSTTANSALRIFDSFVFMSSPFLMAAGFNRLGATVSTNTPAALSLDVASRCPSAAK